MKFSLHFVRRVIRTRPGVQVFRFPDLSMVPPTVASYMLVGQPFHHRIPVRSRINCNSYSAKCDVSQMLISRLLSTFFPLNNSSDCVKYSTFRYGNNPENGRET